MTTESDEGFATGVSPKRANPRGTAPGVLVRQVALNDDDPTVLFPAYDSMPPLPAEFLGLEAHP